MIKFSLGCEKGHGFEGWFSSNDEFARLRESGHLDCPECGSGKIDKLLMAPSVKSTKGKDVEILPPESSSSPAAPTVSGAGPSLPVPVAAAPSLPELPPEIQTEVISQLRVIKKKILANAENVGENFGEEARKIHFGETKQRGIYGTTSPEEAVELIEEGIEIVPLPVLPGDKN